MQWVKDEPFIIPRRRSGRFNFVCLFHLAGKYYCNIVLPGNRLADPMLIDEWHRCAVLSFATTLDVPPGSSV